MMNLKSLFTPSAMLAAITLVAAPSFGDQREQGRPGHRDRSTQESTGRAVERGGRSQRETVAPRVEQRSEGVRPQVEGRRDAGGQRVNPRSEGFGPRGGRPAIVGPRYGYAPRYEPRYEPRYGYGSRPYYRPYTFRPRFSIGFGIFAGYPVPYLYSYPYPVPVYGYAAPRAPVMIGPGSNAYGGISLEITPSDASVYVDGTYVGLVRDFDGSMQPLTLAAGTHQISVEARGFAPLTFDVGVQPGQVIPYRGDMQPY